MSLRKSVIDTVSELDSLRNEIKYIKQLVSGPEITERDACSSETRGSQLHSTGICDILHGQLIRLQREFQEFKIAMSNEIQALSTKYEREIHSIKQLLEIRPSNPNDESSVDGNYAEVSGNNDLTIVKSICPNPEHLDNEQTCRSFKIGKIN